MRILPTGISCWKIAPEIVREIVEQMRPSPVDKLTIPGRLLLILTILLFGGTCFFYFMYVVQDLPSGRYPVFMFWFPVALVSAIFFLIAAWILERLGIPIYKR